MFHEITASSLGYFDEYFSRSWQLHERDTGLKSSKALEDVPGRFVCLNSGRTK